MNRLTKWLTVRRLTRQHERLVRTMRDNWHITDQSECRVLRDINNPLSRIGSIIIVAEQNELGERRVRCVQNVPGFMPEQHHRWSDFFMWSLKAEPITPPRQNAQLEWMK